MTNPLLILLGPTGIGKTEVSIIVAKALNAEIVSCDSMSVYRYMDIGTAKPTPNQRSEVPHYLIDVVFPDEPYNVAEYVSDADKAIADIWHKGKVAMVVGGSSLYLSSLLENFNFPIAPPDENVRKRWQDFAKREGNEALHRYLQKIDPKSAERIHPNDLVRMVRALEVYELTGKPISSFWDDTLQLPSLTRYSNALVIGLNCDRNELWMRIEQRMHLLLRLGWLDEIQKLFDMGYSGQIKPMRALGYREFKQVVLGNWTLQKGQQEYLRNAKAFAKRQMFWFKKRPYVNWIDVTKLNTQEIANLILSRLR